MEADADTRLDALERSNRQLRTLFFVSILVVPLFAALGFAYFGGPQRNASAVPDSLRVRELVVVDSPRRSFTGRRDRWETPSSGRRHRRYPSIRRYWS